MNDWRILQTVSWILFFILLSFLGKLIKEKHFVKLLMYSWKIHLMARGFYTAVHNHAHIHTIATSIALEHPHSQNGMHGFQFSCILC